MIKQNDKAKFKKLYSRRLEKAKKWAKIFEKNQNVVMVALTGSMVSGKIADQSDIDFFVQVTPGRLWSTRLKITLIAGLANERPTKYARAGKICLNWWADYNAVQKVNHKILFQRKNFSSFKSNFWEKIIKKLHFIRLKIELDQKGQIIQLSDHELRLRHRIDY